MVMIYWLIKLILHFPRKAHKCLTTCLAEKKCFTSWTWCKLAIMAYIIMWVLGIIFVFVTIPLYLYSGEIVTIINN